MRGLPYFILSALSVVVLVWFFAYSEVPIDSGDGLAHYFIAQNVWQNPMELLNHWGKPLFTLLASPFAYFGFNTYVGFNILVYFATLVVGYLMMGKMRVSQSLRLIFPFGLLTSMDYASNILGGMTEVFFGLLVLISGLLMLHKKWMSFAVVVSLLPFSRSEGQLLIPLAAMVLIYVGNWRALPFLLLGFVLYALVGWLALDDFWWYLTQNPYTGAETIYGNGTWMHYLDFWYVHLGVVGLILLLLGVPAFLLFAMKQKFSKEKNLVVLYFSAAYFGILLVHMYLWAHGKSGALGLTRLAIHGWPGLLLVCIVILDEAARKKYLKNSLAALSVLSSIVIIHDYPFVEDQAFPRLAKPDERAILQASDFIRAYVESDTNCKVYYYHPLAAYALGAKLKNKQGNFIQQNFSDFDKIFGQMEAGDLVLWDSHFGNRDMNFPEDSISLFREIRTYTPLNQYIHPGQRVAQVKVLQKFGTTPEKENRFHEYLSARITLSKDSLYQNMGVLDFELLQFDDPQFALKIDCQNGEPKNKVFFVVQESEFGGAITFELVENNFWTFSLNRAQGKTFKLFFHNPNQSQDQFEFELKRFSKE